MVPRYISNLARALMGLLYDSLQDNEKGETVNENVNQLFQQQTTFWQRLADKLASIIGSWPLKFSYKR